MDFDMKKDISRFASYKQTLLGKAEDDLNNDLEEEFMENII